MNAFDTIEEAKVLAHTLAERGGTRQGVFTNLKMPGKYSVFSLTEFGHPSAPPTDIFQTWPLHYVAEPSWQRYIKTEVWREAER